jgi:hypothetical protein
VLRCGLAMLGVDAPERMAREEAGQERVASCARDEHLGESSSSHTGLPSEERQ